MKNAVLNNNLAQVRRLIALGENINIADEQGKTLLMHAIELGSLDIVNELLDVENINVNAVDGSGRAALHYLVGAGLDLVDKLRHFQGINWNAKDGNGRTLLILVTIAKNRNIVEYLLEYGIDVNALDNFGSTALAYALRNDAFYLLYYKDALLSSPHAYNVDFINSVIIYLENKESGIAIAKMLECHGCKSKEPMLLATMYMLMATVNIYGNSDILPDRELVRHLALLYAARRGHGNVVIWFLDSDYIDDYGLGSIDLTYADENGRTAFDLFSFSRIEHAKVLLCFLRQGVVINKHIPIGILQEALSRLSSTQSFVMRAIQSALSSMQSASLDTNSSIHYNEPPVSSGSLVSSRAVISSLSDYSGVDVNSNHELSN